MNAEQTSVETKPGAPEGGGNLITRDFWSRYGVPAALLAMVVFFTFQTSAFMTQSNIMNILRQSSVLSIAAIGTTIVLICGGIDISMGAIMALAGIVAVVGAQSMGLPEIVSVLLGLVAAGAVGAVNGLLSERIRIPAFIATLGTSLVVRGISFVYTEGRSIGFGRGDEASGQLIQWFGKGFIGSVPVPVVVMLALYLLAWIVMQRSTWGMHTYAIGSSERAARVAGLKVTSHRIQVYVLAGLLSGLAGVILAGRLGSASPSLGSGVEFDILTAVVLGGTSIYGGKGNIVRTLIGALFLSTLTNGLILMNVPSFYQQISQGLVLLLALTLDRIQTRGAR
ncbi:MAG: ABC transporter permease [Devosia sp.]